MSQNTDNQKVQIVQNIEDLTVMWTDEGLPVFIADTPDIVEKAKSYGFSIFYVLGCLEEIIKPKLISQKNINTQPSHTTQPQYKYESKIFKVVSNFIGTLVTPAEDVSISSLGILRPECLYTMPLIPKVIVSKLDDFFRSVEKIHNSEAIVLLTFDTTKDDSSGWGILVPDQENNAAHCNYDPLSVADQKPDHVMIVGSVHSHPSMSAYASGTDHKDQADFDGLHITFGWQHSVNNNATQYHIEMQMSGNVYTLEPNQVFESEDPAKDPDPEVLQWIDKVKKAHPPIMGGHQIPHSQTTTTASKKNQNQKPQTSKTKSQTSQKDSSSKKESSLDLHYTELFPEYNLDNLGLIVAEVEDIISFPQIDCHCPACGTEVTQESIWENVCSSCDIPISSVGDSYLYIISNLKDYCEQRNIDFKSYKAYLWGSDPDKTSWLIKLEDLESSQLSLPMSSSSSYSSSVHASDFETALGTLEIYTHNSLCDDCCKAYSYDCPAFSGMLDKFCEDTLDFEEIEYSVDGIGCNAYEPMPSSSYSSGSTYSGEWYD